MEVTRYFPHLEKYYFIAHTRVGKYIWSTTMLWENKIKKVLLCLWVPSTEYVFCSIHTRMCVCVCVCIQTHISELFMCTQTQINQAKDQFPASTKTPKLMRSLSECSEAQCTAPACSWIQEYLQSCIAKKCYEQFTQNQLNKHNHALETSSSTKCIFCSFPAACI